MKRSFMCNCKVANGELFLKGREAQIPGDQPADCYKSSHYIRLLGINPLQYIVENHFHFG